MKAKDILKYQSMAKTAWEVAQGWLWLVLMWLSIAVNFTHIQDILAIWSGTSDWSTWGGALLIEAISGLSFSNALSNASLLLASLGKSKSSGDVSKAKKKRAWLYLALSLLLGLLTVAFSAWCNVLWYQGHILAGIVAPIATVGCAIMEASRRYEIQVLKQISGEPKQSSAEPKQSSAKSKMLKPAERQQKIAGLLLKQKLSTVEVAERCGTHRATALRDLNKLVAQGKVKANGGNTWVAIQ